MVNGVSKIDECPFCHSTSMKKMPNDKFDDLFYCESCNHRFRYDSMANFSSKSLEKKKHSAKWDRLVEQLRRQGDVESPEAVATEQMGEESYE